MQAFNATKSAPNANITFIRARAGPHHDLAQEFLERIAAQCTPIMGRHHLKVRTLEEYEPNAEFVGRNFNAGETIQLVLRARGSGSWLPFSFVQMTMMHELAHCRQMNHSAAFWAVRNRYVQELEYLWVQGYTGEGIWGRGRVLGTGAYARDTITSPEALPHHVCGGTYRSNYTRGGSSQPRKRVKAPPITYQERKSRRIVKRFGEGGHAVGQSAPQTTAATAPPSKGSRRHVGVGDLAEGSKPIRTKAQVRSKRGRELRAAAILQRSQSDPPKREPSPPSQPHTIAKFVRAHSTGTTSPPPVPVSSQAQRIVIPIDDDDDDDDSLGSTNAKREIPAETKPTSDVQPTVLCIDGADPVDEKTVPRDSKGKIRLLDVDAEFSDSQDTASDDTAASYSADGSPSSDDADYMPVLDDFIDLDGSKPVDRDGHGFIRVCGDENEQDTTAEFLGDLATADAVYPVNNTSSNVNIDRTNIIALGGSTSPTLPTPSTSEAAAHLTSSLHSPGRGPSGFRRKPPPHSIGGGESPRRIATPAVSLSPPAATTVSPTSVVTSPSTSAGPLSPSQASLLERKQLHAFFHRLS